MTTVRDASGRPVRVDPSDPQAQLVYEWERRHVEPAFAPAMLSSAQVAALVADACVATGTRRPAIRHAGLSLPCHADPATWTLLIATWGRGKVTILHEVAHLAVHGRDREGHGPVFVGMAIALYDAFGGPDAGAMAASARRMGVRVGPYDMLDPTRPTGPWDEGAFADGD